MTFRRAPNGYLDTQREEVLANITFARLVARYGPERAVAIMEGKDPEANDDLRKWRSLGEPKLGRGVGR